MNKKPRSKEILSVNMSFAFKSEAIAIIGTSLFSELREVGLKPREILFCAKYLATHSPGEAYVHYTRAEQIKKHVAMDRGNALLKKEIIIRGMKVLYDAWLCGIELSMKKELVDLLYRRAFYDIRTFQKDDGTFRSLDQIPDEWRKVIDGTEVKHYGKEGSKKEVVVKLANRDNAINKLIDYIQLIKTKIDVNIGVGEEAKINIKRIFEARDV